MGRRSHRRRREAEALAQHVIENQIQPQLLAREARERGVDVDTAFVDTSPNAKGFTVTCIGCGRTAKVQFDPGEKLGLCPQCAREGRGG